MNTARGTHGAVWRAGVLGAALALAPVGMGGVAFAQDAQTYRSAVADTVVKTGSGELIGARRDGVTSYLGVRYAEAERFMAPKAPASWTGVKPALRYGEVCRVPILPTVAKDELFNPHRYLPESENCQFLNVWTPGTGAGAKRPVMVWLHGGGYTNGSSIEQTAYDGENLARNGDVVVVTLNHRLNAMGFLDLTAYGDEFKDSANASVMDLVAALQWVKANAAAFGGDPENVTIFGQSGGGSKVRTLMGTPAAKGLFQKAIVQSGATTGPTTTKESAKRIAELTLKNLGLEGSQVAELKTVPYPRLIEAATKALADAKAAGDPNPRWAPVVDGSYLPRDPVGDGWVDQARDIPLLIGTVLNEQETVTKIEPDKLWADNLHMWSEARTKEKLTERFGDKADAVGRAFMKAYPGKKLADAAYVDLTGRPGTLRNIRLKAEQGGAPVYAYVFTRYSPAMDGIGMAWHCSEIPYVFGNTELVAQATGGGEAAKRLSDQMLGAWVSFARSGNPNHDGMPDWQPFTAERGATMVFDDTSELRVDHDAALLKAAGLN